MNISSRLRVQPGDNALIGGFIVQGSAAQRVLFRAMGPSLQSNGVGVPGRLDDPRIELFRSNGTSVAANDNWKDSPDRPEIESSGFAPGDEREAVVVADLAPGRYTAIVRGKGDSTGIGLVEAYDRTNAIEGATEMANISTRGFVERNDNALFAGFFIGSQQAGTRVLLRAIGPSLKADVPNTLADPTIRLVNQNGETLKENDNWKDSTDRPEIEATGIPPKDDAESAVIMALTPAPYTAIVRGKDDGIGVGVVEVYNVK